MTRLYQKYDTYVQCLLCPHLCKIKKDRTGICGVRKSDGEAIGLLTYGVVSGYSLDPVEKKPLYHFFPGKKILSLGSYGCNMRCDFCQNWDISQNRPEKMERNITIDKIIKDSLEAENNIGVAFTYNEPVIWFEFMRDVALKAKEKGLQTVIVSNGYVSSGPLHDIAGFTDAFNIDLKSFSDDFYRKVTGSDLRTVKETLKYIARSGRHLEITTLIIPGMNDSDDEMKMLSGWIAGELGQSVPLHISRYFPRFRRNNPQTPVQTLEKLYHTAASVLDYVYLGNTSLEEGQDTRCRKCGTVVTRRTGYTTLNINIGPEGNCKECGTTIYQHFAFPRKER
jgi:pyruvate formate lyase activating enzyme